MRFTVGFLFYIFAAAQPALADVRDAVNHARLEDCAPSAVPLRDSSALRRAAQALGGGTSLHSALSSAGYLAGESGAIHLSGMLSDVSIARALAAQGCEVLGDPRLLDIGVARLGRDVWIVLASPITLPHRTDADLYRRQILLLVNRARQSGHRCGGKPYAATTPLLLNAALSDAAAAHSEDMAVHGEFDHQGHDGSSPSSRVARAGYGRSRIVGENIAAGAMTPAEVVQGWLDSPAHCENIMDPRFADLGIGFAVNTASTELVYWTQDFAALAATR